MKVGMHRGIVLPIWLLLMLSICAACFLAFLWLGTVDYWAKEDYLNRALRPGMSRAEVYTAIREVGPPEIFNRGAGSCFLNHPGEFTLEYIQVSPVPVLHFFYHGRSLCFDGSGDLVEVGRPSSD